MPKIFGRVALIDNLRCGCDLCSYTWRAAPDECSDLLANRKVTCPICRLTKEHTPGKPIESTGPLSRFVIDTMIMRAMHQVISNDEKYKDYMVPIRSLSCGHIFTLKSRYFNSWLKEPECLKCNPDKLSKLSDTETSVEDSGGSGAVGGAGVGAGRVIKAPTTQRTASEPIDKAKLQREKIEKDMLSLVGTEQNNTIIIDVDVANAEVIMHCNVCGKERHIAYATYKQYTKETLICPDCKLDKPTLESTYTKYIGKVFNGMKITDVYKGGNKHTLCTVQCLEKPEHEYKNKELGIIINGRFYCPDCTDNGKKNAISINRLRYGILNACKKLNLGNSGNKFISSGIKNRDIGYNGSSQRLEDSGLVISVEQFYTAARNQDKSICDFCIHRDSCKERNQTKTSISFIASQADMLDNINEAKLSVSSRYPSVYSPMFREGASVCDTNVTKQLLMFRDAYRGRDKLIYRFCKCITHGTELLLTETEILDFDHTQCADRNLKVVRFFDIDNEILLGNKKDTKNKK